MNLFSVWLGKHLQVFKCFHVNAKAINSVDLKEKENFKNAETDVPVVTRLDLWILFFLTLHL